MQVPSLSSRQVGEYQLIAEAAFCPSHLVAEQLELPRKQLSPSTPIISHKPTQNSLTKLLYLYFMWTHQPTLYSPTRLFNL